MDKAVADSDLKMRGGGAGTHPEGGGPVTQKFFFRPFGPQFGLKLRGAPPPGSATAKLSLE